MACKVFCTLSCKPGGSYRRQRLQSNLELDHIEPVMDSKYRWRLAKFDLPNETAKEYLELWGQELVKCRLLCIPCHQEATRSALANGSGSQVSCSRRYDRIDNAGLLSCMQ